MFKIGDFSKLTQISIRMLRYYDEYDILKPAKIDEVNGYRYYDAKQMHLAYQIKFLKDIGFSVAMIKEILDDYQDHKELERYFEMRLCELKEEKQSIENTLQRLQKVEELLKKENLFMKYEVEIKEIQGANVIATRGIIPTYDREDLLWKRLCSELEERNMQIEVSGDGARAYFYDEGYKESDVDIEICQVVTSQGEDTDNLKFKHLPNQTCACVTFKGGYHQISEVSLTIGNWINKNGYTLDGANFCIYHVGYGNCENEEEFVTEVCYPICK